MRNNSVPHSILTYFDVFWICPPSQNSEFLLEFMMMRVRRMVMRMLMMKMVRKMRMMRMKIAFVSFLLPAAGEDGRR